MRQLGELEKIKKQLHELGYQLLAISPDAPQKLVETSQKHKLTFALLSDDDLGLARDLGIVFQRTGRKPLPVPAVFFVDKDGTILFQHVDPNYRVRLDNEVILAGARTLQ